MAEFLLTLAFQLGAHEPMRRFPQDHIPRLESWSQLQDLIVLACQRVRRENPQYGDVRQFTVEGRTVRRVTHRRLEQRQKVLEMLLTYNPLQETFTVDAASFDFSLRSVEEDMNMELGKPLVPEFREETIREEISLADIDVMKLRHAAEPAYPEYRLPTNEWQPRLENEWQPIRADETVSPRRIEARRFEERR